MKLQKGKPPFKNQLQNVPVIYFHTLFVYKLGPPSNNSCTKCQYTPVVYFHASLVMTILLETFARGRRYLRYLQQLANVSFVFVLNFHMPGRHSRTGNRTRAAWVKTRNPNHQTMRDVEKEKDWNKFFFEHVFSSVQETC